MEASDYDGSYEFTTNWRISGGSLVDSVAFESSISSAAGNLEDSDEFAAVDSAAKPPLVLLPPTHNCDPCEITITFAQKHELRQVYVRSSARVYEIYCVNRPTQSNEYLCTVRCSLATRGEEVLQAPVIEATALVNPEELSNSSEGKRSGGTSEDDWVEVKASDASLLKNANSLRTTLDLYEATAEMNDTEPCISVTLRFLSLQDKGCVFVDEVYIFADPADPTEPEQEGNETGNSTGESLMAMFMPTLLQLSRAKDVNKDQHKQTSNESERSQQTMRNSNDVATFVKVIQQEADMRKNDEKKVNVSTTTERADPETSQHVIGAEIKPASACNHTDMILHQLVYRVSRIEDILTRFEDQLLKPIKSIDTRLQQVEQKLEELGKKRNDFEGSAMLKVLDPDFSGSNTDSSLDIKLDGRIDNQHVAFCSRIVAPEFSCGDADLDSSFTDKSENYDVVELKHKDNDLSAVNSSVNMVDPLSDNQSLPGTEVVTAESEISDEKEGGNSMERGSSEEKPKHSLSINDALASALAGLLSSTSTTDKKYSQALVVTAPDFLNEDDSETEKKSLNVTCHDKSQATVDCSPVTEGSIFVKDLEKEEPSLISATSTGGNSSEMVNGVAKNCNHSEAGYDDVNTVVRDGDAFLGESAVAEMESDSYAEGNEKEAENQETTKSNVVDDLEGPDLSTGCLSSGLVTPTVGKGEPKTNDVLQSILGFQRTSSSLDFGTPVLDVKFNLEPISENKFYFEALLNDSPKSTAESIAGVDCINDSNYGNFISVDEEELIGPPTDTLSSVDLDYCEINCMHRNLEGETQSDRHVSSDKETTAASLI